MDIVFDTPALIQTGHHYVLTLTSNTGQPGNQQYFIKGMDVLGIQDSLTGTGNPLSAADTPSGAQAPEPSSWAMMAAGVALVLGSRVKRRRRTA